MDSRSQGRIRIADEMPNRRRVDRTLRPSIKIIYGVTLLPALRQERDVARFGRRARPFPHSIFVRACRARCGIH